MNTRKNIILALFLSLTLVVFVLALCFLYPVVSAILISMHRTPETGGIAVVAGGVSGSVLKIVLVEPIAFLGIFALLRRRRARR